MAEGLRVSECVGVRGVLILPTSSDVVFFFCADQLIQSSGTAINHMRFTSSVMMDKTERKHIVRIVLLLFWVSLGKVGEHQLKRE